MKISFFLKTLTLLLTFLSVCPTQGKADDRISLPIDAFDGGVSSAETLGRGGAYAAGEGGPGSAVENPAAIHPGMQDSFYVSTYLGVTSDVEESTISARNPVEDRVLQYLAVYGERGVLFFQPLGRINRRDFIDPANPNQNYDETEFAADSLGFSGSAKLNRGFFGMSISYLRASFSRKTVRPGQSDQFESDRANGFGLNFGLRYPTGPVMWGISFRNAPAFLFWRDYKRTLLPFSIRAGNAWRVRPGTLFLADVEKKFYNEGAIEEETLHFGWTQKLKESISYRLGVFSDDMEDPEQRHYTAGISIATDTGLIVTYAAERFEINGEKALKSFLSVTLPFVGALNNEPQNRPTY